MASDPHPVPPTGESAALRAVKTTHTVLWAGIETCMLYVLATGLARRTDRSVAVAGGVVAAESAVFALNGFRCPMTGLAEQLGADSGSVTDLYLPQPLARALPAIHVPLVALAVGLHARNLRRQRRAGERPAG